MSVNILLLWQNTLFINWAQQGKESYQSLAKIDQGTKSRKYNSVSLNCFSCSLLFSTSNHIYSFGNNLDCVFSLPAFKKKKVKKQN